MTLDLDAIEKSAREAAERKPGAWSKGGCHDDEDPRSVYAWDVPDEIASVDVAECSSIPIAAYIAQCSPDTILAMVAGIRKLEDVAKAAERLVADYRSDSPDGGASTYELCKAVDRLRGEDDNA